MPRQKTRSLPRLGRERKTFGLRASPACEPDRIRPDGRLRTRAELAGDDFVVNGEKLFTLQMWLRTHDRPGVCIVERPDAVLTSICRGLVRTNIFNDEYGLYALKHT